MSNLTRRLDKLEQIGRPPRGRLGPIYVALYTSHVREGRTPTEAHAAATGFLDGAGPWLRRREDHELALVADFLGSAMDVTDYLWPVLDAAQTAALQAALEANNQDAVGAVFDTLTAAQLEALDTVPTSMSKWPDNLRESFLELLES